MREWLTQFKADSRRMLVIAHREELLDQAADKILKANPGLIVSIEQAERYAHKHSDVVIASIQTLAARKFARLRKLLDRTGGFRVVIVDEAHHAAAPTYRGALALLGFLPTTMAGEEGEIEAVTWDDVKVMRAELDGWDAEAPKDRLLVGVTATPNRSDSVGLDCVFQAIAYDYDLRQAITDKWLVPIVPWVIETESSLDAVRTTAGEFNQKDLAEAVNVDARNDLAVAAWHEHAAGESTIAFTVDVAHAHALAETFRRTGVKAEALSGETPKDLRRDMLRRYTAGELTVVTNCMVLTEGTDLPRTGCILHAKPTKSATLYEQMTGRGLRIHPGKVQCIVLDLVDVARRHSLQTAPVLYGLPPSVITKGETLDKLKTELDELLARTPGMKVADLGRKTLAQLRAIAKTFDIWAVPRLSRDEADGLAFNWIPLGDQVYRLSYPWEGGNERILVTPDVLGHFTVELRFEPRFERGAQLTHPPIPAPGQLLPKTLGVNVETAKAAMKLAETFVRGQRRQVERLLDTRAPWMQKPATEPQISALRKWRVVFTLPLTAGEASRLLDLARARSSGGARR